LHAPTTKQSELLALLDNFKNLSGLEIKGSKTEGMWRGSHGENQP